MGPQRRKTPASLQWRTRTPWPSISSNVMELELGGVRGWGGTDPPQNHPDPQTLIPSPATQSTAQNSHRPPTERSQPEAANSAAPLLTKEQTSRPSPTKIPHTNEGK
ncbi:hypothetical protein CHARACLAT_033280 [Characodon lateralis]|uniref:Uncharacterized protein n=1 Tax=Characodon lateralis TaxID=208331 RepID=A0ABU7E705_9TELE|nr:hypothetical protein [Characodon lateralis]